MDLNAEFYKETGKQADDGYRYTDYYVEWLESKLEFRPLEPGYGLNEANE